MQTRMGLQMQYILSALQTPNYWLHFVTSLAAVWLIPEGDKSMGVFHCGYPPLTCTKLWWFLLVPGTASTTSTPPPSYEMYCSIIRFAALDSAARQEPFILQPKEQRTNWSARKHRLQLHNSWSEVQLHHWSSFWSLQSPDWVHTTIPRRQSDFCDWGQCIPGSE